jgi:outer membrane lipoprotein SlyB
MSVARLFIVLAAFLAAAGCATTDPNANLVGNGVVQSIFETKKPNTGAQVVGTVGGALLGAWAGSMIGGGTGQTIASVAGGVGGSMAGSAIANNAAQDTVWDVTVLFDNGITRTIRVSQPPDYKPGSRVRVNGSTIAPL